MRVEKQIIKKLAKFCMGYHDRIALDCLRFFKKDIPVIEATDGRVFGRVFVKNGDMPDLDLRVNGKSLGRSLGSGSGGVEIRIDENQVEEIDCSDKKWLADPDYVIGDRSNALGVTKISLNNLSKLIEMAKAVKKSEKHPTVTLEIHSETLVLRVESEDYKFEGAQMRLAE